MELKLDYLNEIAGGDTTFINEILETYLQEIPKDMELLHQFINSKDISEVQKTAHKMKSSFRLLGLNNLYQKSLDLEIAAKQQVMDWKKHETTYQQLQLSVNNSLLLVQEAMD